MTDGEAIVLAATGPGIDISGIDTVDFYDA